MARVVSGTDFCATTAAETGTTSARGPPLPPDFTSARAVAAPTMTTTATMMTILRRLRLAGVTPAGVSGPSFMTPPAKRGERPGGKLKPLPARGLEHGHARPERGGTPAAQSTVSSSAPL